MALSPEPVLHCCAPHGQSEKSPATLDTCNCPPQGQALEAGTFQHSFVSLGRRAKLKCLQVLRVVRFDEPGLATTT